MYNLFLFTDKEVWKRYVKGHNFPAPASAYKMTKTHYTILNESPIGCEPRTILTYRRKRYLVHEKDGNCLLISNPI